MFTPDLDNVVLIRKSRPEWQAGRLNGVGGKVEEGEDPYQAMRREFWEETGVNAQFGYMGQMLGNDWVVDLYCEYSEKALDVATQEDEEVVLMPVAEALALTKEQALSNVPWLVGFARDFCGHGMHRVRIEYRV